MKSWLTRTLLKSVNKLPFPGNVKERSHLGSVHYSDFSKMLSTVLDILRAISKLQYSDSNGFISTSGGTNVVG